MFAIPYDTIGHQKDLIFLGEFMPHLTVANHATRWKPPTSSKQFFGLLKKAGPYEKVRGRNNYIRKPLLVKVQMERVWKNPVPMNKNPIRIPETLRHFHQ